MKVIMAVRPKAVCFFKGKNLVPKKCFYKSTAKDIASP